MIINGSNVTFVCEDHKVKLTTDESLRAHMFCDIKTLPKERIEDADKNRV